MRAISYEAPGSWRLAQLPDPRPGPGEVLLDVVMCGVCGTDVHLHRGEFGPSYPLTPGHEIVGRVASHGDGVSDPPLGELVALDNMTACGTCRWCQAARPQFCASMTALGVNRPGGFGTQVTAPAGKCHPVGALPVEVAVFAEPLSCVVHGLDVLRPRVGSDALVIGTGPTGLLMAQLLRSAGAARVVVAGRQEHKLELAAALGADETARLGRGDDGAVLRAIAPDGFDVVVDATGAVEVLQLATTLLAVGGTVFVYGMTDEAATLTIDPYDVFRRELTIRGSFSQAFAVGRAVGLLQAGRVRTDGMITFRAGLHGYADALHAVEHDRACVKAVITP